MRITRNATLFQRVTIIEILSQQKLNNTHHIHGDFNLIRDQFTYCESHKIQTAKPLYHRGFTIHYPYLLIETFITHNFKDTPHALAESAQRVIAPMKNRSYPHTRMYTYITAQTMPPFRLGNKKSKTAHERAYARRAR